MKTGKDVVGGVFCKAFQANHKALFIPVTPTLRVRKQEGQGRWGAIHLDSAQHQDAVQLRLRRSGLPKTAGVSQELLKSSALV